MINILYTLNDKFVPQVASGICSVCENNKDADGITFYLFSTGITNENKKKLEDFVQTYHRSIVIKELGNMQQYFDFEFDTTGWNPIVLARLLLDKFLPEEVERVLYLDGDTIVRGSLQELWNTNMGEHVLGASIEPTVDKNHKKDLGLEGKPYYNAGVLLVDLKKWREQEIGKKVLEYYKKNNGRLFANDQDAINGALADYIHLLLPKYNFCCNAFCQYPYWFLCKLMKPATYIEKKTFLSCVENPIIIHYLGEERPWRIGNHHKYKKDYMQYLNQTPWSGQGMESGWRLYYVCWDIFNVVTKPLPGVRYHIINSLIPTFVKIRAKKNKKKKTGDMKV